VRTTNVWSRRLNDQSRNAEPSDSQVEAALRDYLERVVRGETLDRETFVSQHPEIADELRFLTARTWSAVRAQLEFDGVLNASERSSPIMFPHTIRFPSGLSRRASPPSRGTNPQVAGL
jgi:hypothetical protein